MSTPLVHYLSRMDIERMNEIGIVSPVLDIPRSCYMYEPSEYIFIVSMFMFKLFIAKRYYQVVVKEVSEPLCCVTFCSVYSFIILVFLLQFQPWPVLVDEQELEGKTRSKTSKN